MLLQTSAPLEPRCPRRWSLPTAAGLLTLAVLLAGVGLAARAAPVPVRKEKPKDDKKEEPKKEQDDRTAVMESMLKRLPPGTDPAIIERMREQMRRYLSNMPAEQLRQMREQMARAGQPIVNPFGAVPPGNLMAPGMIASRPNARLGALVQTPGATLAEQLDLPKGQGLVVQQVQPDSAADKAGLKPHDILLELDGKPVSDRPEKFLHQLEDIKPDTVVEAVVLRRGKKETIKELKLPEAKAPEGLPGGFPLVGGGFAPPQPAAIPVPGVFPAGGNFPLPLVGGPGVMTTLFHTTNRFTLRHQEGSLVITLTGKTVEGKPKVSDIQVQDGAQSDKYESVDKVPDRYRDKVKNLIEMSEKSSVRVEIKSP